MPTTYAIPNGRTVMDATLYTGTTAYPQTVVNQLGFKPDLVWAKARSAAYYNGLFDSNRSGYALYSNSLDPQDTTEQITFNTNGFSTPNKSADFINTNGTTYVAWQWKANGGTTSSNTNGSVTSTTQVNSTAGFSIVSFTAPADGVNFTVGHGLGTTPAFFILKELTLADGWPVWSQAYANTAQGYMTLNTTNALANNSGIWNNTAPSSTVISMRSGLPMYGGSAVIMYCWAQVAGFSSFGSYTGNGSTDGPFVYCGFRPKFILLKSTNAGNNWEIFDSSRNPYNQADLLLLPSSSAAESNAYGSYYIDFVSNGFKIRGSGGGFNASGETMIYAVFAENPFKYANAR